MEGHGERRWWPPAHPWAVRRDEALALRSSRYSWRLPILLTLVLLLLGTTLVRGLARLDPVAIGVPLVLGGVLVVVVAKALDARIERRTGTDALVETPALRELRGLYGLEGLDAAEVPSLPAGVRALHERADGTHVRVVAGLRREDDLVVALVTSVDRSAAQDLVVVRRLPVDVGSFHVRPGHQPDTRVGAGLDDLFDVAPGADAVPAPLASWLVTERPHLRLEGAGDWLGLQPPADRPPADGEALVAACSELIVTADQLAARLRA